MQKGILYIVATPIGNLKDITLRAIDTLNSVDLVACEDTRVTQKLLNHYGISTKTISYHKFSEMERSIKLIQFLNEGNNVALVSDAGTPLISDPGSVLVKKAKENGIKIVPICGPSAVITALSAIGSDENFAFCGFFPQKRTDVEKILMFVNDFDLVFYESPNRILKSLYIIKDILETVEISLARELTKIYEDINTLEISEMINYLETSVVKGEIVFVIHKNNSANSFEYENYIQKLLSKGYSAKDTAQIISTLFDVGKNEVYRRICK